MKILPLTYLGNVEYFSHLLAGGCVIDLGENYVKQTYRNRCEIMSPGGTDILTVNVVRGGSSIKRPMRDMRIDYSKRWQHRHHMALVSAYKNSPYFDHYWERFAPFYEKRYEFLADLNAGLLSVMADIIAPGTELHFSENYITPSAGDVDLRGQFEPLKRDGAGEILSAFRPVREVPFGREAPQPDAPHHKNCRQSDHDGRPGQAEIDGMDGPDEASPFFEPYWQVFSEKYPFVPNLSAIDLIFCEGPGAGSIISAGFERHR